MSLTKRFYLILVAGLAGGLAEIFWVGIYSTVTHADGWEISRQITASLIPAWSDSVIAPMLGMVIHLALSVMLAFLYCKIILGSVAQYCGRVVVLSAGVVVLAIVWAINFLVILPVINPAFVTLLPFLVTFTSKILFGWAMGIVLTQGFVEMANRPV